MNPVVAIELERDEDGVIVDLRLVYADGTSALVSADAASFAAMEEVLEELADFYDSATDPEEEPEED